MNKNIVFEYDPSENDTTGWDHEEDYDETQYWENSED